MSSAPDFTTAKALSFDVYGTLVDYYGGLRGDIECILSQLPDSHPWAKDPSLAVARVTHFSRKHWREEPKLSYDKNLTRSLQEVASEAGVSVSDEEASGIGSGPGRWAAFADTVEGLLKLKKHYKLIILSNVNNENIERCIAGPLAPVPFDRVYTAQNIGSYKPDRANFRYLFEHAKNELGVDKEKGELLHVAHSLTADHVPAKELELRSVWISRNGDKECGTGGTQDEEETKGKVAFEWRVDTIGKFAEEVERQFAAKN